jgi:DNA transformation protein and related proteins
MPVTPAFREYALEQLGRTLPVTARSMFGGVGIYSDGLFFALLAEDMLYLKVDDTNRADFERAGMAPFQPYGEGAPVMQYYPVPADVLEDAEALGEWAQRARDVARRKRRG